MTDLTLFDDPDLTGDFEKWIESPHGQEAYRRFVQIALATCRRGLKIGAMAIWERVRWNVRLKNWKNNGETQESFKMNNNYRKKTALKAMRENPELRDYFEIRDFGRPNRKEKED